jgi:uncharacterized protein (DUF924 family)
MGQQQLDSRDALACVIVLDQFSRHLFRGSKRAFAFDQGAQAVTQRLLSTSDIEDLSPIEQVFLLHPFHHAEDLHLQHEGCNRLQRLITSLDLPWQTALTGFLQSFKEHALIVERFGRFPHRNRILGRKSSDAEQRFLDTQTRHFGQQHGTH